MAKKLSKIEKSCIEDKFGITIIDERKMIIDKDGSQYRQIKDFAELLCINFDNVPVLTLGDLAFVSVDYNSATYGL